MSHNKSSSKSSKIILVTGSNKGIGYEAVRLLSEQNPNDIILLGSRDITAGEKAIEKMKSSSNKSSYDNIKVIKLDVTDKSSIQLAAEGIKKDYSNVDILINNAGISNIKGSLESPEVFNVNIYGVKNMNDTFLPLIPSNGSIIVVSSEVGSWTHDKLAPEVSAKLLDINHLTWNDIEILIQDCLTQYKGEKSTYKWPTGMESYGLYGISKSLVSAYVRIFALQHPEIHVTTTCPGYCATDLNQHRGTRTAAEGGESIIWAVTNKIEQGHFYKDGKDTPYSRAHHV